MAGAITLLVAASIAVFSSESDQIGFDLRAGYLPAAEAVRDGDSPYADPDDPALDLRRAYVYPPQLAIGLVPLSWLPTDLAAFLVFLAAVAALLGAVALVGVRDVRCYAAVLLWAPTWNALDTLNVSAALALGVALVWRFRSTLWPLAATLGAMVSVKLFLWPLLVWVALVRRPLAAILAAAIGFVLAFGSWAAIGFAGLGDYPELLSKVGDQENYSIVAIAEETGLGPVGPCSPCSSEARCSSPLCGRGAADEEIGCVHARRRRVPRAEPGRVAPLPHVADRAAGTRPPALLCALAAADSAVGEPA